jgi:hypothetical protein
LPTERSGCIPVIQVTEVEHIHDDQALDLPPNIAELARTLKGRRVYRSQRCTHAHDQGERSETLGRENGLLRTLRGGPTLSLWRVEEPHGASSAAGRSRNPCSEPLGPGLRSSVASLTRNRSSCSQIALLLSRGNGEVQRSGPDHPSRYDEHHVIFVRGRQQQIGRVVLARHQLAIAPRPSCFSRST